MFTYQKFCMTWLKANIKFIQLFLFFFGQKTLHVRGHKTQETQSDELWLEYIS